VRVIAQHLSAAIPHGASVLDVGCGDGWLAAQILETRPDLTVIGVDVLKRQNTRIPVHVFDGINIPFHNSSIDIVLFVDVLHHTQNPLILLREARRVTRRTILIKDHLKDGLFAEPTLRVMDWVGNARHGVVLPYNYWTSEQWKRAATELGLRTTSWKTDLDLYPTPARWIFERALHFIGEFEIHESSR
jgi:SAM-dependent methyltransferase